MQPPPLLAELRQRLLTGIQLRELAGALAPRDLGIEVLGVALAPQDLGAVATGLAPAHAPDDAAVLAHDTLDAHDADPPPSNSRRKLPRTGGGAGGGGGATRCSTRTVDDATHASNASRGMRSREHRRTARSSPRSMAR